MAHSQPQSVVRPRLRHALEAAVDWLCRVATGLACGALATLVLAVFSRLVLRWLGWDAPAELDQYRRIAISAFVFLSLGPGLRAGVHLAVGAFMQLTPGPVQRAVAALVRLLLLVFLAALCWAGVVLSLRGTAATLTGTHWPETLLYITIPLGGFVGLLVVLQQLLDPSSRPDEIDQS